MDGKVIWTDRAITDLQSVVAYVATRDREAARKIGYAIVERVQILEQFPLIGPVFRQTENSTVRQIVCGSYRIFYRLRDKPHSVDILHVWHGTRQEPPFVS